MNTTHAALTFDDVLLVPGYSEVLPREVKLETKLTRDLHLNVPLLSAAMDTVTEADLAIALAQEGGIGIIHKNMSAVEQAAQVREVKKFESGVIRDPITVGPSTSIRGRPRSDTRVALFRVSPWSTEMILLESSPVAICDSRIG